ncbi:MAG: hypothetical protein JXM71_08055, partial [Spirochaetales bacterium]|nr:hypothetical protein [Spirochaetales bacterium]
MRSIVLATLIISVLIGLFLGIAAFLRARSKGRFYSFSLLMLAAATYAGFYAAELLQPELSGALLCIGFEYVGVSLLTIALFFVVRDFSGAEKASPWL